MPERLHVSRGLQQRSIHDLSFRHGLAGSNEHSTPRLDEQLHCTFIESGDENAVSLQALASLLRTQPKNPYAAKVIDVIPVGRRQHEARVSYALELELDKNIAEDYDYCHQQLMLPKKTLFIPHVTLMHTVGASKDTERSILRNIESFSPSTISLTALRARLSPNRSKAA